MAQRCMARWEESVRVELALIHGFVLAFGLILPIGMQNSFLLTQGALHKRWANALPAVITAGICDTLLIAISVLGVSAAALHVAWLRYTLGIIGIFFLVFLGVSTWRQDPHVEASAKTAWTPRRQIGFTLSVSLLNPHALVDTLAVLGGSALAYSTWPERVAFGLACILVSWIWFFTLSIIGHFLGTVAVKRASLQLLNKVSAVMMWASGVYLAYIIVTFR